MKKILLLIVSVIVSIGTNAQSMKFYKSGQLVEQYSINSADSVVLKDTLGGVFMTYKDTQPMSGFSKEEADSVVFAEDTDTTSIKQECRNHILEHVAAVAATANLGGNIEYWHCPTCFKYYSDAEGATEISNPFLPSYNRTIGPELLRKYPSPFAWNDVYGNEESETSYAKGMSTTSIGVATALQLVKTGVGIVSGVLSCANTIKKMIEDTSNEIHEINEGIKEIKYAVNQVERNTKQILGELEDAKYAEQVGKKVTRLSSVYEYSIMATNAIDKIIQDYEANLSTEDAAIESIKNTLASWAKRSISDGEASQEMISSVEQLLDDFLSVNLGSGFESFPEIVRKHVQTYIAFDNAGYGQRAALLRYYQFSITPAFFLYKLWKRNVDEDYTKSPYFWEETYNKYENDFVQMNQLIQKDSMNMCRAYMTYRAFRPKLSGNGETIYFKANVRGPFDFSKWIDNHFWSNGEGHAWFPGDDDKHWKEKNKMAYNNDGRAVQYAEKMWNEVTGIKGLSKDTLATFDDYQAIRAEYPDSSFYSILKNQGDFIGSHLYGETVKVGGKNMEFYYFYWQTADPYIKYGKGSIRTIFHGETGYDITDFTNTIYPFSLLAYKSNRNGYYNLTNFGIATSLYDNAGTALPSIFYQNVPIWGQFYEFRKSEPKFTEEQYEFGAIHSRGNGTKNGVECKSLNKCFGILERYYGEVYE